MPIFFDLCELQYFSTNLRRNNSIIFSALVWYSSNSMYLLNCFNSNNLFGCVGMKRNEYCIFNRQYRKDDYAVMADRIVQHMKETGEWGKYFPMSISHFSYNNSVAQDYYPMDRANAVSLGLCWTDPVVDDNVKSDLSSGAFICSKSGKQFRVTKQESKLCERLGIPLPTKCPNVRREERMNGIKRAIANYI
mgnify:CR=1 FL=1